MIGNASERDLTPEQLDEYRAEQKREARTDLKSRVEDAQKKVLDQRVVAAGATLALWALHIEIQYVAGATLILYAPRLLSILSRLARG